MKKLLSFLFILTFTSLLTIFLANTLEAARKKIIQIACIDIQKVINTVAADRVLIQILENKKSALLQNAERMAKDIYNLKEIVRKEKNKLSKQRLQRLQEEINHKQQALNQFLNQGSSYIQGVERNLSVSVLRNLYGIVKAVAIREGYSLVLEKGTAIIYVDKSLDITSLVIDELNREKKDILKQ